MPREYAYCDECEYLFTNITKKRAEEVLEEWRNRPVNGEEIYSSEPTIKCENCGNYSSFLYTTPDHPIIKGKTRGEIVRDDETVHMGGGGSGGGGGSSGGNRGGGGGEEGGTEPLTEDSGTFATVMHGLKNGSMRWKIAFSLAVLNDFADIIELPAMFLSGGLSIAGGALFDLLCSFFLWPTIGTARFGKTFWDYIPILDLFPIYTWEVCIAYKEDKGLYREDKENPLWETIGGNIWFTIFTIGGIVILLIYLLFSGLIPLGGIAVDLAQSDVGQTIRSPTALMSSAWSAVTGTTSAISSGIETQAYKVQCQQEAIRNSVEREKQAAYINSCVCKEKAATEEERQNCPNWKNQEEETPTVSVSAQNYLEVDMSTTIQDALHLRDVCGERCGRVEVTLENHGSKPVRVEDIYLELKNGDNRYPIRLNLGGGEPTLTYRLRSFTEKNTPDTEWTSLQQSNIILSEPGETKKITFLADLEPRETCIDQPDDKESSEEEEETFGDTGECDKREEIFGNLDFSPEVTVGYSSWTSTGFNLEVIDIGQWREMDNSEKEEFRRENCRSTGSGTIQRQVSTELIDAVSLLMYTDCEVHYYPDNPDWNQKVLRVAAKGDSSKIDSFTIDAISGTGDICDYEGGETLSDSSHPRNLADTERTDCKEGNCESPTAACLKKIPPSAGALNLGLEAEYTAKLTEKGEFLSGGVIS